VAIISALVVGAVVAAISAGVVDAVVATISARVAAILTVVAVYVVVVVYVVVAVWAVVALRELDHLTRGTSTFFRGDSHLAWSTEFGPTVTFTSNRGQVPSDVGVARPSVQRIQGLDRRREALRSAQSDSDENELEKLHDSELCGG